MEKKKYQTVQWSFFFRFNQSPIRFNIKDNIIFLVTKNRITIQGVSVNVDNLSAEAAS